VDLDPAGAGRDVDAARVGENLGEPPDDRPGQVDFGQVAPVEVDDLLMGQGQGTARRALGSARREGPVPEAVDREVGVGNDMGVASSAHERQRDRQPGRVVGELVSWWVFTGSWFVPGILGGALVASWTGRPRGQPGTRSRTFGQLNEMRGYQRHCG
jgi:hypothetical protein